MESKESSAQVRDQASGAAACGFNDTEILRKFENVSETAPLICKSAVLEKVC